MHTHRYRLKAGIHITWHPGSKPLTKQEIADGVKRPEKIYKAGDVVDSDVDLVAKYGFEKFELMPHSYLTQAPVAMHQEPERAPAAPEAPTESEPTRWSIEDLQGMTLTELREVATEESVDLRGATKKEDIIRILTQLTVR